MGFRDGAAPRAQHQKDRLGVCEKPGLSLGVRANPEADLTVASLRVRDPLRCLVSVSHGFVLEGEHGEPWAPGWGVESGEARDTCSQVPVRSPFPPAVSYQQGILSATILYEILLGKATLYAVLVSALVLMAKVKRKGS
nr:uncharacterized protein LOC123836084 [Mirounga angustirostris]